MKDVIIFHAMGANPDSYWYPYLKQVLEQKGYSVSVPILPNTDKYISHIVVKKYLIDHQIKDEINPETYLSFSFNGRKRGFPGFLFIAIGRASPR